MSTYAAILVLTLCINSYLFDFILLFTYFFHCSLSSSLWTLNLFSDNVFSLMVMTSINLSVDLFMHLSIFLPLICHVFSPM